MKVRMPLLASLCVVLAGAAALSSAPGPGFLPTPVRLTTTGNASLPVYSPDGRKIAFVADSGDHFDVAVMNPDGSGRRTLTAGAGFAVSGSTSLAWSRDGEYIAFTGSTGGPSNGQDVFVVDVEGVVGPVNLTNNPPYTSVFGPQWSPNGKRIVFDRNGRICVMDPDGGNLVEISTIAPNDPHDCSVAMDDWSPAWSPNGQQIAFLRRCEIANQESHLYVMNADGSDVTMLMQLHGNDNWDPAWSPNGRAIVFASAPHASDGSIYLIDPKDGTMTMVSGAVSSWGPAVWSRDGRQIAFMAKWASIYTVNADGTGLTQVFVGDYLASPSWSRNGLVFEISVSDNGVWSSDIYALVAARGTRAPLR